MKRGWFIAVFVVAGACIIPDRGIQFEGGLANPGAVRILKPTQVPVEWSQWCLSQDINGAVEGGTSDFCPSVRETRGGGLVDGGTFCICPQGQREGRAPQLWTIYAEDPDLDGDDPTDTLYGVLRLDPDPLSEQPTAAVAFENYLEPCAQGEPVRADFVTLSPDDRDFVDRVAPSIARNTAAQWAFEIDDAFSDRIDLCNDNNGVPLEPGLHNLQFMVTDRPFFRATREDSDVQRLQCGVPDVASGATYAVTNYVFECLDGTLEDNADACECEDEG
ncbi:MAG: hypothetical protein KUG77_12720 [Nannocystaceae bacterium]|nr:hypothetical protein [Nannocystaceae bacterium]